jgi:AcrR family transcriptional regulator
MKRGEAKRQAILDTAYQLFLEQGFEKTSMSEITVQVGGSKATLYNHFTSKEELFVECMTAAIDQYVAGSLASLDLSRDDMEAVLQHFGENFLQFSCSKEMIAVRRLMISEAARLEVGMLFLKKISALRERVADYLKANMESGKLRKEDPGIAANHLRGLLESEVLEPLLLGVTDTIPEEEKRGAAHRAIDAFLRAYAP